ncbi:OsmC family protein [Actinomadura nitritigenes]|uniref:OsmC family protein n=1 Tax=Actinomadura nitritigenes TaxID=134602 RepID=UPI0034715A2A
MQEIKVVHRENDAFTVFIRDHVIGVDQPYTSGGMDEGPTPVELFVAALAACAAHYARRYLAGRALPATGLEITADFAMNPGVPARVARVRLHLRPPVDLPAAALRGLEAAVASCTVQNSMLDPPRVELEVLGAVPAV